MCSMSSAILTLYINTGVKTEGNVLFNNALSTLYLHLYGIAHMIKGHLDEKGNPLLPLHGALFSLAARDLLSVPSHRTDGLYATSCGALAGVMKVVYYIIEYDKEQAKQN